MKIDLKQLLPSDVSDETAFHLVNFVRNLSLALESIYFDNMLSHNSRYENKDIDLSYRNDAGNPF